MRKAKKVIWIMNGILLVVILVLGLSYLIGNSQGLRNDKNKQNTDNLNQTQIRAQTTDDGNKKASSEEEKKATTIAIAGDVLLKESHQSKYDVNGKSALVSSEVQDIMKNADITMINEEFPFSMAGNKAGDKENTYRVNPKYISFFNDLGVDIVSLANNHTLDYGTEALVETFKTLDGANIKYTGAGETLNRAKEVQYIEVNGYKVAFIAASRVVPENSWSATDKEAGIFAAFDTSAVCDQITDAQENADYVIAYMHWGVEYKTAPENYQQTMAKEFIDAGADAVIGSHTHCLQGIEYYDGRPIVYGLGNFIFDQTIKQTAVITVTLQEGEEPSLKIYPCFAKNGKTDLVTRKSSVKTFYKYMQSISDGIEIDTDGVISAIPE